MIDLKPITHINWRAAMMLTVRADQLHFVSDTVPIAALVLAKAFVGVSNMRWVPLAMCSGEHMVGMCALAASSNNPRDVWLFHFFIDQSRQRMGHGAAGLQAVIQHARDHYDNCMQLRLMVHPDNIPAQRLYAAAGFRDAGEMRWDQPVFQMRIR